MTSTDERQHLAETLYALLAGLLRRVPRDISLTAASTLATLERAGDQRITDLATRQGITQPSMTTLVSNLTAEGLVERRRDPSDGRASLISITDSGAAYVRTRRHRNAAVFLDLLERLDEPDLVTLVEATAALDRLRELDAQSSGDRPAEQR
jgi:DNA-binding MarR family transcriptional regulator